MSFTLVEGDDGNIIVKGTGRVVSTLATTAPATVPLAAAIAGAYWIKPVWAGVVGGLVVGSAVGWGLFLWWGANKLRHFAGDRLPDVVVKQGKTYTLDPDSLPQRMYTTPSEPGVKIGELMLKMMSNTAGEESRFRR